MKKLILLSIIFLQNIVYAQNYKCVSENDIRFFTNSNHYLRAMRIDSVKQINGKTVLYPFRTARGEVFSSTMPVLKKEGSWLGHDITVHADGTHWFKNYNNDTVIIKTQASVNDKWIFYDDTSAIRYEAIVLSEDTMSLPMGIDTVKIILLTAKNLQGNVLVKDTFNNRKLIISKNYGFVQTFDLYMFPLQRNISRDFDHFTQLAGAIDFKISDYYNPDVLEIYNHQPGEVFQTKGSLTPGIFIESHFRNTILNRNNISSQEVEYSIQRVIHHMQVGPNFPVTVFIDTVKEMYKSASLFSQTLPEEWGMTRYYEYNSHDTSFCNIGKYYSSLANRIFYQGDTAEVNNFEPCNNSYVYKTGMGQVSFSDCSDPSARPPHWYLIYANKNSTPCGKYFNMSVSDTKPLSGKTHIFPNPANDNLTIELTGYESPVKAILHNSIGQKVSTNIMLSGSITISTAALSPGIYFLTLLADNGASVNRQIVVAR